MVNGRLSTPPPTIVVMSVNVEVAIDTPCCSTTATDRFRRRGVPSSSPRSAAEAGWIPFPPATP